MKTWKRFLPDVLVVVLFAVISFAYFFVPVTQGKILYRHDASAGVGSAQEMTEYQNRTGEATRWTNAIFGGMPTYQMSPSYQSTDGLSQVMNAYHLWLPDNVWFLFVYQIVYLLPTLSKVQSYLLHQTMVEHFVFRKYHLSKYTPPIWAILHFSHH